MNTNSIPNANSVEPQIAERLQNIYWAELPTADAESRGAFRICYNQFLSWAVRYSRVCWGLPSPLWWTDAGVAAPGNICSAPFGALLNAPKNFSNHKECKSIWIFKLSMLFDRTALADGRQAASKSESRLGTASRKEDCQELCPRNLY